MALREKLAALNHEQWMRWAKDIQAWVSPEDQQRWRWEEWPQYMVPYEELAEEAKDKHREWADKILELIDDEGIWI